MRIKKLCSDVLIKFINSVMREFLTFSLIIPVSSWGAIEDNSFFIEEAYNQDAGEYQFMQTYETYRNGPQGYGLELEMPITHLTHQFSLSMGTEKTEDIKASNFADLALSYRWQMFNSEDKIFTQRLTYIVPTGSVAKSSSNGVPGYEWLQSATILMGDRIANHWNFGAVIYPQAQSPDSKKDRTLTGLTAGTSVVYLHNDRLNFLLEGIIESSENISANGGIESDVSFAFNPGIRWSYDYDWKGTQVVPGLSMPLVFTGDRVDPGVFFYLSIESTLH